MNPQIDLRALRESVGLSQFKLAKLSGVTSMVLSSVELGKIAASADVQTRVIEAVEAWKREHGDVKPKKRSPGKRAGRGSAPSGVPLATNCCEPVDAGLDDDMPVAISLFSGCGGLAGGFSQAGYAIAGFSELVPEARATFKRNFPAAKCLGHDVVDVSADRLMDSLRGRSLDVLAAGPPCQGFSLAGKRRIDDPRNELFREVVRLAEALQPKALVVENVRLLSSMKNDSGTLVIDEILAALEEIGYLSSVSFVNAQDYGVPQFRERLFVVGIRSDLTTSKFAMPAPSHGRPSTEFAVDLFTEESRPPFATFRDATADLEPLESGDQSESDPLHWAVTHPEHVLRWLRDVPEGASAHDNEDPALRPTSGYNTTYKRLRWDEPSSTIGTTFGMISGSRNVHPKFTRSLTVREAARCQTFPDDYVFEGNWGAVRTMIGNAVPPTLGKVVALQVLRTIR